MIKLVGLVVIAVGFALRCNTLLTVLGAVIATGFAAGMSFATIMTQFGRAFTESRSVTLPIVLIVAVVGLLERYGLQERAEILIRQARAATAGRILLIYTAVRQISIALGVNIGGHAGMVRPLIAPLAEAAARTGAQSLSAEMVARIRAHAAAAENIGNFFGEDIFVAVGAVLLMNGFFVSQGRSVSLWAMALWGIPTAVTAFVAMYWRCRVLDRRVSREATRQPPKPSR